jgi:hypothetical protein
MSTDYRIEPAGTEFTVIDPWGEPLDRYLTEDAARQDIERCVKEHVMWETAKLLVGNAIKTHTEMHNVDRETSSYWIDSALGGG